MIQIGLVSWFEVEEDAWKRKFKLNDSIHGQLKLCLSSERFSEHIPAFSLLMLSMRQASADDRSKSKQNL